MDNAPLKLFDANARLGNAPSRQDGEPSCAEEIVALMNAFNVDKAMVYHAVAQYSDIMLGNSLLPRETGGSDRFLLQWAVLPPLWELYPKPREWIKMMRENGVVSVRIFPKQYGHSLRRYAAAELFDALGEAGIPVFVDYAELPNADALYELCEDYPATNFVLCSPGYRCLRQIVPIMDSRDNLYIETSNLFMHNGLTEFCRYQGAGRLLFGSGMPTASLAAAASQLLLSDLPRCDKEAVASGNLKKLLGEANI